MCPPSFLPRHFLLRHEKRYGNPKRPPISPTSAAGEAEFHEKHPSATTAIEKLPVELLQLIARFLAPESAACFTLCSKSLQWAIGNQSWFALRTSDQKKARLSFLILLQRDLRDWLLCYHCEKLYPFNLKTPSYVLWLYQGEHPCAITDGYLDFQPEFGVRFQYAQMIMKLYQLKATEHISLDSLSFARSSIDRNLFKQSYASARIANDNLLVKMEERVLLYHGDDFKQIRALCQDVCPHWDRDYDLLAKRIRCQMSHGPGQSCPECTGLVQCPYCSTEFIVAYLNSTWSPGGQALYITIWKNLGPCDTPFDNCWRTQLSVSMIDLPFPTYELVHFVPGSIRMAFEDLADFKIGVDGLSTKWPLDSDVEFLRLVVDVGKKLP